MDGDLFFATTVPLTTKAVSNFLTNQSHATLARVEDSSGQSRFFQLGGLMNAGNTQSLVPSKTGVASAGGDSRAAATPPAPVQVRVWSGVAASAHDKYLW